MDAEDTPDTYRLSRKGWIWLSVLLVAFGSAWIAGWFDDATVLTPSDDRPLTFGLYAACLVSLLSAIFIFVQSKGALYRRVVMSLIVTPIFALFGVFLLTAEMTALIENARLFPAEKTETFEGLLFVKRAYQTHGKGRSWNVQTMPIWSNLDITQLDYEFMLNHRSPDDHGTDPDEITSNGYFCIKGTLQQSGAALRILNAGTYKLPRGSVVACSEAKASNPMLRVIS